MSEEAVDRSEARPKARIPARRIVAGVISVVVSCGLFFFAAGRLDWVAGWAFLGLMVAAQGATGLLLKRRDPELMRRRSEIGAGTKRWDKVCLGIFGVLYLTNIALGAVDGGRFGWSSMSAGFWPAGLALFSAGMALTGWAMAVNTHFEKTVRIQHDRRHRVITEGPYGRVRHPGYVGVIFFVLATPLLLMSWWAFVPAVLATAALVVRTLLEDRTLRAELPGYGDYARRVRFRLVPGLW